MSSRGYNETLTTPSNHKDSSGMSLKAFDTHFKTLNNGLLSVARNLSGMHTKVGELEVATKSTINLKHRVDTIEKTLAAHGKVLVDIRSMLGEMSKSQQTPPNEMLQSTAPAAPQKSRVQLMLETQRLQVESKAKSAATKPTNDVQLVTPASTSTVEKTSNAKEEIKEDPKEDINAAVEDLLKATVSSSGVIEPIPKLDQILESANSVKTHDTYPDSDDETLAAVLKAKSGDPESDEDEPTSNASAVKVSGANTPKVQTQPKANPQKEDSESESEDDDNPSSESEDDDEDIEISDVEEESKSKPNPAPAPAPAPAKPVSRTQTGPSKPAPKPIPRRMVPQKKK